MTMHPDQPLSTADIARGSSPTTAEPRDSTIDAEDRGTLTDTNPRDDVNWSDPTRSRSMDTQTPPAPTPPAEAATTGSTAEPLFAGDDADHFHTRWTDVQAGFVDDPRQAVEQADGLVAEVIKNLAQAFATERSGLESQWQKGEDVSTEDLRQALRRYRSFFDRLLSV